MLLAIIQARISSTRLPGKVLRTICGKPMLQLQLERVKNCDAIDKVIIATSVDSSDDLIEQFCKENKVYCYRGSLYDVLDRFYHAAEFFQPEHILRLTGDCPLIDPDVLTGLINIYFDGSFDYVCNTQKPTFPDGLDCWIFKKHLLEIAWHNAKLPSEREHVTMFFINNQDRFNTGSYEHSIDYSDYRWTVDEPEDLELVTRIFEQLYPKNSAFGMNDVVDLFLNDPSLKAINAKFIRDEGLLTSLEVDKTFLKEDYEY